MTGFDRTHAQLALAPSARLALTCANREAHNNNPPQCCVPLPSILRSPSIEGYRNKAEFTIGLDAQERPAVGFLLGSFKVCMCTVAVYNACAWG